MKLFCHYSCYSECSVLEQQISAQQFGNGEFIYTFRDSGGFIFSPSAAAPLHHISSKGPCPSVQAWHRNPSHSLLRCHMTWLTALCKNRGSPGLLTILLAFLCMFSSSIISVFSVETSTVHYGNAPIFYTRWYPTWWYSSFCWQFWFFCCCSQCRTDFSKWSMMPVPSALSWMKQPV